MTNVEKDDMNARPGLALVLASGSPRRRYLLGQLHVPFRVMLSGADERTVRAHSPEAIAVDLAIRKAIAVAAFGPGLIVLGADTIVVVDGEMLGKPTDGDNALAMLRRLRGRSHDVLTGLALVDSDNLEVEPRTALIRSTVTMRAASDDELLAYVATEEPLDKAGAYAIQGQGAALIERLEGCYTNVVGMPICEVSRMLDAVGVANAGVGVCLLPDGALCPRALPHD